MSTCPNVGLPSSIAVALFLYAERTSHGRSMCPSCRHNHRYEKSIRPEEQGEKGVIITTGWSVAGEHGTYDNGCPTKDYVCGLKWVGREPPATGPRTRVFGEEEEGEGNEKNENEPGTDEDAVAMAIGSCRSDRDAV